MWRIDYSDESGAGDYDYPTREDALTEARAALASGDMPWAVTARLFEVDTDGEPAKDQSGTATITK